MAGAHAGFIRPYRAGTVSRPECRRNQDHKECRKEGCPFYPVKARKGRTPFKED